MITVKELMTNPTQSSPDGKRSAQRKPLTDELVYKLWDKKYRSWIGGEQFESIARAVEQVHNIKEQP